MKTRLEKLQNNGKPYEKPIFATFPTTQAEKILSRKGAKWRREEPEIEAPKASRDTTAKAADKKAEK